MGIFRTLYREARDLVGLKPPVDNAAQLAERVCGEVKGELGGKKAKQGEDWTLELVHAERKVHVLFEVDGLRTIVVVPSELEGGPTWTITSDPKEGKEEAPDDVERSYVASGVYVQGTASEVKLHVDMWKALPTGTRGNLSSFVQKHFGELTYEDEQFRFTPGQPTLNGTGPKYNVKSQIQTMVRLVGEIEKAWQSL